MNLYFVSLLRKEGACDFLSLSETRKKEVERKKNLYVKYEVSGPLRGMDLLKKRYPRIQKGDLVNHNWGSDFWNVDSLAREPNVEEGNHPFFYDFSGGNDDHIWNCNHLSASTKERISSSKLERKDDCLLVSNFKIGKTKYELVIKSDVVWLPFDEKQMLNLESKVRSMKLFCFQVDSSVVPRIDDYKNRYKKRLFLFF
jgi:hypothetical protein